MHQMDHIYKNIPLNKIPWNMERPPKALLDLVANKNIVPCKTIDLGCGLGHYAHYLANCGFDVTGIDISTEAIKLAQERSKQEGIKAAFRTADMIGDLNEIKETFDFAYDWEVLHHIFPNHRQQYIKNVHQLLNPKGKYLSVCFSIKDQQFGGQGKYRDTKLGTTLYFSSENELKTLFEAYFIIKELKTIEIEGKMGNHLAVYCLMTRK
ncbi:class I SAM-dependent methyltransferase [Carboxylicivirga marina]|uniref:Class I SAM-dependent methyltransferase n=1 Tax=Carboxylicivirga marina TaxID=2800988 RepID=A0ABS1HJ61_9BACT|nr:class I SAM-dependent methyltransferase [Carboxylicivirga marina]MBK3517661.1 class I SAM-dependent methyltransferase [Carboxylicivirga marina]